ncbi:RBBP9/YdeN family alpha/beta hydrolase [Rhizobium oryziradicis]|uniref:Esterase n=1 Tax=Rhizobium oryziradicis TaxID=1867956 RepID=A0A1Q8ZVA4_9HYPH|nr:alpha/beta hydrolase [Rhizobium oryziradicis]OLP46004.1 hypothetical protein BJF95_14930 [Rhizobium oryziradicis]
MPESNPHQWIDTLVLPGLNGSGDGHWQSFWLKEKPDAKIVEQDNWTCPDLASWYRKLESELEKHSGIWLVAHSLGCILTANLALSPMASRIRGALLVAPCDLVNVENLHPCIVNFGSMPVQRLPFPSTVVASRNDPYMEFETTRRYANLWGSDLIDIGAQGHVNIQSGHGRWPLGYTLLERLKSRAESAKRSQNHPLSWAAKGYDLPMASKLS